MATTELVSAPKELDAGMMVRRALFLLVLLGLTYYFLGLDFRGLSHPKGMEQAQIAREVARKNGFTTKEIKGLAWKQQERRLKEVEGPAATPSLLAMTDTYHSPLNPLLNSLPLGLAQDSFTLGEKQTHYTPDIIIAGVSMLLLLASIGITYLLISRIFDPKIGGVTALLMLLCETLWRFSQSGLPQMLMLFLFSFGAYFLYKSVETRQAGKPVYLWICLAAGFFGLLALAHWITLWMFIALLILCAFYFTPRGVVSLIMLGIVAVICLLWVIPINYKHTGSVFGAGFYTFYSGLSGTTSEEALFRDIDQTVGGLNFQGFARKGVFNSLGQIRYLYDYLGGIVAAPLFFLSLLHPFRRKEIGDFRWFVLVMWLGAVFGMTLYGIKAPSEDGTDPNNLHVLFIPLMTGYGLAFLSVLWNRLNVPLHIPVVKNGHFVLVVVISALPFLLNLPIRIMDLNRINREYRINYPYIPRLLAEYGKLVNTNEVVVSDIPWAVAWYMDRSCFWLPKDKGQLTRLMDIGRQKGQPVTSLLLSPLTLNQPIQQAVSQGAEYYAWREYMMFYPQLSLAQSNEQTRALMDLVLKDVPLKHPNLITNTPFRGAYLFMRDTPLQ